MGKRKLAPEPEKKQLSSYTRRRLEQLAENDLAAKEIIITSGSLKGIFCTYGYDHKVAANTTNSMTCKSEVPVHDDLIEKFKDLHVHLAVICEEIKADQIPDIDNLPELNSEVELSDPSQDPLAVILDSFSVSSFKIVGNGENEGVSLVGQKRLSTGDYVKLETPATKYQSDYPFVNELHVAIFNLVEEIEAYMQGKQAPSRQQELPFGENGESNGDEDDF